MVMKIGLVCSYECYEETAIIVASKRRTNIMKIEMLQKRYNGCSLTSQAIDGDIFEQGDLRDLAIIWFGAEKSCGNATLHISYYNRKIIYFYRRCKSLFLSSVVYLVDVTDSRALHWDRMLAWHFASRAFGEFGHAYEWCISSF